MCCDVEVFISFVLPLDVQVGTWRRIQNLGKWEQQASLCLDYKNVTWFMIYVCACLSLCVFVCVYGCVCVYLCVQVKLTQKPYKGCKCVGYSSMCAQLLFQVYKCLSQIITWGHWVSSRKKLNSYYFFVFKKFEMGQFDLNTRQGLRS